MVAAATSIITSCSPSNRVVDCYDAASFAKKHGLCAIDGTLVQTGTGFAVRPKRHKPITHDLRIMVQDGHKDPSITQITEIGEFTFCGRFEVIHGFTVLEVPFNEDGTYSGNYNIDNCGDA